MTKAFGTRGMEIPYNPLEIWKLIPGYPDYEVSDHGHVRRIGSSKMLKPSYSEKGYLRVAVYSKFMFVHYFVALAFIGPKPEGCTTNHKDTNKDNNTPSNLEYITHHDNVLHSVRMGVKAFPRGEQQGGSILTDKKVKEILAALWDGKEDKASIARRYGVNRSTICDIDAGRTWNHIPRPTGPRNQARRINQWE